VRRALWTALVVVCLAASGCLKRPETVPTRMLEPQLLEPQQSPPADKGTSAASGTPIRLLDTQARGHIGRRLLHQQPSGELTEDAIWRWSSSPDRYLDSAIRLELAANQKMRLVDSASSPSLAATLLAWHLESVNGTRLVGAVEFQFIGADRVVRAHIARGSEPVSGELPGDLAAAAGRLLSVLAKEGLAKAAP
jgi:hypothetical protein